jgi:hypothetical protein
MNTLKIAFVMTAILLAGCQTTKNLAGLGDGGNPSKNFYIDPEAINRIERVVLMPVHAPTVGLPFESEIDTVFASKLTAIRLFEVVTISREDLVRRFGKRSFNSAEPLSEVLFRYAAEASNADAVVMFDLTTYHPYQPIRIGIRSKMIDIKNQEVLWAVDELFDASSRKTAKRASNYERKSVSKFPASKQKGSILVSPMQFTGYAAEQCIDTLPENSLE